jgi:PleD family two-component response regulator
MGVAKLHDGDTAPRDLFRRADTALLTAKRAGRNCVRGEGSPYSVTL